MSGARDGAAAVYGVCWPRPVLPVKRCPSCEGHSRGPLPDYSRLLLSLRLSVCPVSSRLSTISRLPLVCSCVLSPFSRLRPLTLRTGRPRASAPLTHTDSCAAGPRAADPRCFPLRAAASGCRWPPQTDVTVSARQPGCANSVAKYWEERTRNGRPVWTVRSGGGAGYRPGPPGQRPAAPRAGQTAANTLGKLSPTDLLLPACLVGLSVIAVSSLSLLSGPGRAAVMAEHQVAVGHSSRLPPRVSGDRGRCVSAH